MPLDEKKIRDLLEDPATTPGAFGAHGRAVALDWLRMREELDHLRYVQRLICTVPGTFNAETLGIRSNAAHTAVCIDVILGEDHVE